MKKEDKNYLLASLILEELKNKYNLELRIYDLITKDLYNDGNNMVAIYNSENELYYIKAYMSNNCPCIYSCEKFIKEQD